MSQCLNPNCLHQNPANHTYCEQCGNKLLLGERYRAIKIIGQGGFGRTFQAVDEQKPSKPKCVIKQFFPQAQGTDTVKKAAELFEQEAVRLDELGHHDQIPELKAYLTQDSRQYLVQEYVDGQNLTQELKKLGSGFKEDQIWQLLNDLLPVLKFIHAGQVIHRDIKPDNIIRRNRDNKLVLVDFGAAKFATGTALANTGTVIGSAEYIAPEQTRGKATFASDLYSLGVTCIYLMTQVSPFDLFDINEGAWVWRQFLVNNPCSDNLGQILDKLIENFVNRRYQTATEVLQAIRPSPIKGEGSKVPPLPAGVGGDLIEMIAIPSGSFLMGSTDGSNDEKPQHQVTLAAFYIGKYPITQEQYQAVMGNNPSKFKKGGKYPVERVSWDDAQEFCQKLSKMTGRTYRLPSEAQWEYAARATTQASYYFGDNENQLKEYAWYDDNSHKQTHPVGEKKPNKWGLYDILGNVWEWCEDDWHDNYNGAPTDGRAWIDNDNRSQSEHRIIRGGSWYYNSRGCRCANRSYADPARRRSTYGFRVAVVAVRTQ